MPDGWWWERLGDLGSWIGGGTPSKANAAFWTDGEIPWVSPKDMKASYIEDAEDYITHAALEASSAKLVPSGSVVLVMRSGILSHSLPVAVTRREVTLNQDLRALFPRHDVRADFVAHYLRSVAQAILHKCSKDGTTVSSIETERLMDWPVPMATTDVQDVVLRSIGGLFDELEEGEGALAQACDAVELYRRALLGSAVTGELTADWRAEHPPADTGEALLHRILNARRAKWNADPEKSGKRYVEPSGPDAHDLPALPDGWVWATLRQLAQIGTGSTPSRKEPDYWVDGDIPWLTSSVVNASQVTEASQFVTTKGRAAARLRIYPSGTLLVALYGEGKTRGTASVLRTEATINQALAAIMPVDEVLVDWLKVVLDEGYERNRASSSGGVQPNLNLQKVGDLPVPIGPAAEIKIAVERLHSRLRASEQLVSELSAQQPARLRQSILSAAFRGDLIVEPQT